jgi:hypothetical protein
MAWLRADDVFAAADAEAYALNPAPWLDRREGPLRRPDEGRVKPGRGDSDLEDRLRLSAAKMADTKQALADAEPSERRRLTQRVAALRAFRARLLLRREAQSQ